MAALTAMVPAGPPGPLNPAGCWRPWRATNHAMAMVGGLGSSASLATAGVTVLHNPKWLAFAHGDASLTQPRMTCHKEGA